MYQKTWNTNRPVLECMLQWSTATWCLFVLLLLLLLLLSSSLSVLCILAQTMWVMCAGIFLVDQEVKVSSPDYKTTDKDNAIEDFRRRIAVYEQQYNSLDEELDKNLSFIKIYNQGERYLINNIHGMKLSSANWCAVYLFFWPFECETVSSVWRCSCSIYCIATFSLPECSCSFVTHNTSCLLMFSVDSNTESSKSLIWHDL